MVFQGDGSPVRHFTSHHFKSTTALWSILGRRFPGIIPMPFLRVSTAMSDGSAALDRDVKLSC
jgi:hypothetical protein